MLAVSPGFLAALAAPHQVTLRADVSKAGVRLYSGLPVIAGSIEVDSSSITRRRLSCQLAPRLPVGTYGDAPTLPTSPGDPLGHYGQEITISWGLVYTDGVTEWIPVGVFRIEGASGSLLSDGPVQVSGVSREAFVADARFTAPYTASSGSAQSLIGTLIHEVLPTVEVVVTATMDRRVPRTTWDEDRWGAIADLATSIAAVVYADPWGRFVIADAPTLSTAPVWRVAAGTGGVLVGASLVSPVGVRTNLALNPNFETGVGTWIAGTATVTRSATYAYVGSYSCKMVPTATNGGVHQGVPVVAGVAYTLSAWVRSDTGTCDVQLDWVGVTGASHRTNGVSTTWTQVSCTGVAPTTTGGSVIYISSMGTSTVYVDAVLAEASSTVGTYFDGSTPNTPTTTHAWTGTPNASTSTESMTLFPMTFEPGGVLVSAVASASRAKVYNGVIVRSESPSSDAAPVQGSAYDLTAGSPTRWGDPATGAFGMVPYFMALPSVTTVEQAVAIARSTLAKHTGAASTLDVSAVPNAALEAGDVVEVIPDAGDPAGSVRRHVVDAFTLPLVAGGDFPMKTRDVGAVTYG